MTPIRIVIADDHSVLRAGLRALLEAEPDIEVVGEAEDGVDCIGRAVELEPDVILLDINMPHCNGLEALAQIHDLCPSTKVLVLTMLDDVVYLRQVLASGGAGYVLKQAAGDELLSAIRTVQDGGVFLHPHHALALASEKPDSDTADSVPQDEKQIRLQSLSERETEVFRLVALGHSNGEIAELMFLSVKTIETYKARLMKKLGLGTRAELVRYALEVGMLN
ncbi:MAG: response regulator transcription factor [Actinomycetota bacterium]|nr:response regulator transcription factor [Actinomycetota bacterium]